MSFFVEVGAFNCVNWSHTYDLALQGWGGLMFEPQHDLVEMCRECYRNYPKITIDECAIGSTNDRDVKLYLLGSMSTIRRDMVEVFAKQGYRLNEDRYVIVHMYTLDNRLEYHKIDPGFDLLVVDVEGAEMEVFTGFTIGKWKPKKVIVEACDPCPDDVLWQRTREVREYLTKNGYIEIGNDGFDLTFERDAP